MFKKIQLIKRNISTTDHNHKRAALLSTRLISWAVNLLLLLYGCVLTNEVQAAITFPVVDTGQKDCYNSSTGDIVTCIGTGYDADYDGNQPSYTLSGDGLMVMDNITGLTWTSKVDTNNDETVDVTDKLTQPDAVNYCAGLTYGGYTWRLPTVKELYSLMDFRGTDPTSFAGNDSSVLTPFIDGTYFERAFGDTSVGERIIDAQYATTSFYVSPLGTITGADTMFGVNFVDGRIKGYPYNEPPHDPKTFFVHCVTGATTYGQNDFSDNGDATITDQATGLMWEQDDYQSTNFDDAVSHCETATTGGHNDWRLPNIKELHSIVDYSRAPDYTSSAAIDPVFNATSFMNEGGQTDWGYYWASTTHVKYAPSGAGVNGTYICFGRALGYYTDPITTITAVTDVHLNGSLTDITGNQDVGILAGAVTSSSTITNCTASGTVNGYSAGGLVGILYSGTAVSSSYGTGLLTGSDAGGLTSSVMATATVTDSYWDTETTGQAASAGGIGLTTGEMQCPTGPDDTGCKSGTTLYPGWDLAIWNFGTSSHHPALIINGRIYRDNDSDGIWDFEDTSSSFPWAMFLPAIFGAPK